MIEIFSNIGQENLVTVLHAALNNPTNKIHVEAIGVNTEDSEAVVIKREFNTFTGEGPIEKLQDLEVQIEKLKLTKVKIIVRTEDNKVRIFNI